ncbi:MULTISPECIES: TRM11 family SAM-dependent methyltransferase [unclassified Carboxylicivirga]|uniref:TRM11 family SAM-dependent methyltransferase n=1 Tax=Carboxylicivirga TaxID=1628153 RepID=UPI003D3275EB
MMKYLILQNPGHNRVYYKEAAGLAVAELSLAAKRLSVGCQKIDFEDVCGVRYITITLDDELSTADIAILSRLSFTFAIFNQFGLHADDGLAPIAMMRDKYIDDKISTIQRYAGKTNELFTKMMVNVALLASDFNYDESINLLDPVAGRGTTLNEATVYGFNAFGIEIEAKSVHENQIFFKKYLQNERYKFLADKRMVHGKAKGDAIYMHTFEYAANKELFKDKAERKRLGLVCGNAQNADKYFKKNCFNIIVGDLPYGIAHGNAGANKSTGGTRNPSELIQSCLPAWKTVLKKGGTIVLAWNSFVAPKNKLADLFVKEGFKVLNKAPYDNFEHQVDKAIKRDIIVAKKC